MEETSKHTQTNPDPVTGINNDETEQWNRIQNLIRKVKDGIVNLERPLGGPKAGLVYRKCPDPPSAVQSSLDLITGRGPVVTTNGGQTPCDTGDVRRYKTDDPIEFLRKMGSKSRYNRDLHYTMVGDSALKGCTAFTDKDGCENGKIDQRTLQSECDWDMAQQTCGSRKEKKSSA